MYAGMFDETQAVAVGLVAPADSCGGGQGSACDLPINGAAAPISPADVIKKSLRVDMFRSPDKSWSARRQRPRPAHTISVQARSDHVANKRQRRRHGNRQFIIGACRDVRRRNGDSGHSSVAAPGAPAQDSGVASRWDYAHRRDGVILAGATSQDFQLPACHGYHPAWAMPEAAGATL